MTAEDLLALLLTASGVASLPAYCCLLARKLVESERRRRGVLPTASTDPALGKGEMDCPICLKEVTSLCEAAHFTCECECLCHWDCARLLGEDTSSVKCPTCRAEGPVGSVSEDLEHLRALCRLLATGSGPGGTPPESPAHHPRLDGKEVIETLKELLPSAADEALDGLSERLGLDVALELRSLACGACRCPFDRFSDVQTVSCNCREPWALHASCATRWVLESPWGCPKCHAPTPLDVFSVKDGLRRMGRALSSRGNGSGAHPLAAAPAAQLRRRRAGRFIPCLR